MCRSILPSFAISLLAGLAVFSIGMPTAFADETPPAGATSNQLTIKTERVIIFKDGYCLIVKSAQATTNADGVVYTDEVPDAAVLGSFWAQSDSATIRSMVAGWEETTKTVTTTRECTSLAEVLDANSNADCTFETVAGKAYSGKITRVLKRDDHPTSWLVLETQRGFVTLDIGEIRGLEIGDMQHRITEQSEATERHKRLSIDFGEPNTEVALRLMYFRPGIRWIPTYRIDLTDEVTTAPKGYQGEDFKSAKLSMQAELINEAEDLTNVPIHIVVGVPNFRFKQTPSPLTLESTMRQTLAQTVDASNRMGFNNFANSAYSQVASDLPFAEPDPGRLNLPAELSESTGNDLVVYALDAMSLLKGQRATVPITSEEEVAYRDVYTWDIDVLHTEAFAPSRQEGVSPLTLSQDSVWRQVELVNSTSLPWTTGAAMFVDGFQPLAQELLTYTSPGQICRVPVTVAVDLRGQSTDQETGRQLEAYQWRGRNYAEVEGQIALELLNNKSNPVPVEIRLRFGGKAFEISDAGKLTLSAFRPEDWQGGQGDRLNNSSTVRWKTEVQPGDCFKPTTSYKFWLQY